MNQIKEDLLIMLNKNKQDLHWDVIKYIDTTNAVVSQKKKEIEFMKSSKFWKLRSNYIVLKNKIIHIAKNPIRLIKFF